jgi:hypothetical protein
MMTYQRLYEAEYINIQRLARFMKVDDSGSHDELVNRVFDAMMVEAPMTQTKRDDYENMWEVIDGIED